jgi:hypothetical protein
MYFVIPIMDRLVDAGGQVSFDFLSKNSNFCLGAFCVILALHTVLHHLSPYLHGKMKCSSSLRDYVKQNSSEFHKPYLTSY